jgi:hypothetical protein
MSEIRINIIDCEQTISGTIHGSFGDILVASLAAEPETIEELETAVERYIKRESDWSVFRSFRKSENFEPYDAGLLVIDLSAKVIMAESTYSYYSKEGSIRIKTLEDEDFNLPYKLSEDWKRVGSEGEFNYAQDKGREKFANQFDVRKVLFGKPLFEFIVAEYLANKTDTDENLFTEIHAKWLMTPREDLQGKTPREILLDKEDFIGFDLHTRSMQYSFTGFPPPPLSKETNAYKFSGFGIHEIVVYYDLFRFLLDISFAKDITQATELEQLAEDWLNTPQGEFSGKTPAKVIENERQRINETTTAHDWLIDEDCECCQAMSEIFDTPGFWHLDGSNMEYDRFEFSFEKNREDWEAKQREMDEFNREFNKKYEQEKDQDDDFFDRNQEIL